MKKGAIPLCLLAQLSRGRMYGFEIIRSLKESSDGYFMLKEGTVYPALHRLERRGLLSTETVTQIGRPPRKYYSLTPSGKVFMEAIRDEWQRLTTATQRIIDG